MSNIVYVGQDFTITGDTTIDLSANTTLEMRYKKPDKTTGALTGSVISSTKCRGTLTAALNNQAGDWVFQVYAVIGGSVRLSKSYTLEIKNVYT